MTADPKHLARESAREVYRQSILEAAERVFLDKGFHKARMAEIASVANLATGTLYNYFASKEAIFKEMMTAHGNAMLAEVEAAIADIESPTARIEAMVEHAMASLDSKPVLSLIFSEMTTSFALPDDVRICHDELHQRFSAVLQRNVDAAQRCGELRDDLDADLVSNIVFSAIDGVIHCAMTTGAKTVSLQSIAKQCLDVIFHGVKR